MCPICFYKLYSAIVVRVACIAGLCYFKQSLFASLSEINNTAENSQQYFVQQNNLRFLEWKMFFD